MDTRTVRQHASLSDVAQDVASQRDNGIAPHDAANYALAKIGMEGIQWSGHRRSPEDIAAGLRQAARESEQGGAPTLSQHGPAYLRAVARMLEQGPGKCGEAIASDVRHAQARRGGGV